MYLWDSFRFKTCTDFQQQIKTLRRNITRTSVKPGKSRPRRTSCAFFCRHPWHEKHTHRHEAHTPLRCRKSYHFFGPCQVTNQHGYQKASFRSHETIQPKSGAPQQGRALFTNPPDQNSTQSAPIIALGPFGELTIQCYF